MLCAARMPMTLSTRFNSSGRNTMTMTIADMSARDAEEKMKAAAKKIPPYIVSSDDHVYEPSELWDGLPQNLRSQISRPPSDDELDKKLRPRGGRHPLDRLP